MSGKRVSEMTDAEIREMAAEIREMAGVSDQLQPQTRQVIDAVLEAISIPYPASAGDELQWLQTLSFRVTNLKIILRVLSNDTPSLDVSWSLAFLREQLAKPQCAVGYETDYKKVLGRLGGEPS